MAKKIIFSGIQPSGNLHIGNYLGMIREMIRLQDEGEVIFMIADLHAITVKQDPKVLRKNSLELTAWLVAAGFDDKRAHLFVQSENPDHSYLAWIFDCITPMGELERMTQYKDKASKQAELTSVGLFNYPILQATDVLLYDVDLVPVGEDQTQHVELMRDIARRFNKIYGETFKEPKVKIRKETARVMSLTHPDRKMSKSDNDPSGTINLTDKPEEVQRKIAHAVTDSSAEVNKQDHGQGTKGGIQNLLGIHSALKDISYDEALNQFEGNSYADFKEKVTETVISELDELQRNYANLVIGTSRLNQILDQGRDFTNSISSKKLALVKEAVGLGRAG